MNLEKEGKRKSQLQELLLESGSAGERGLSRISCCGWNAGWRLINCVDCLGLGGRCVGGVVGGVGCGVGGLGGVVLDVLASVRVV